MMKSITIDVVVSRGVPLVFYAREILQSQKNVIILMFVSSMEAGSLKEDSNSAPMVTGLTFVMSTHPTF
jgi:hypothetical protein